jgi:gliding-associated putative ABC transporter substrate-binding component GldG
MNERNQVIIRIIVILGIVVVANMIAVRFFKRIDLTQEKIYTLSDASKNLVKTLDDKFTIKAYFKSDLPSPYNNNRRYLQDELDEYKAYGGGNFQYEFIDPGKNDDLKAEAQRYGIPPVQVQVLKDDKLQIEEAYMGLVFLYGDKQERLPVVQSTSNLEYEISSTIKKMTSKELKKVGFLTGQGEPNLQQIGHVQEILSKQYQVTTVDLAGGKPVPNDLAALIVDAPDRQFKSWEKFLIDQYIMRGGRVAFFLNMVTASLQNQMGRANDLALGDLLESYGVRVNADLVRDVSCAYVTVSQQAGSMILQNQVPFFYLPRESEFNKTSPVVKDLSSIVFYFVSSVDTSLSRPRGLTSTVLVKSSPRSGRQENMFVISPNAQFTPDMFKESGIPLAVTVEGAFASAYGSRSVNVDSSVHGSIDTTNKLVTGKLTKIVVVGDGDFLQDQLSGGNRDNFLFASNLVDWLADDIGLASIRSRNSDSKPLNEVSEGTKTWVKGINLAVPPFLVVLVGIARWRWRGAMRKRLETKGL